MEHEVVQDDCKNCCILKNEIRKKAVQVEHSNSQQLSGFLTLKQKIIATDKLIREYQSSKVEVDILTRKNEEFARLIDQLHRDLNNRNQEYSTLYGETEPLKKLNAEYEVKFKSLCDEAQKWKSEAEAGKNFTAQLVEKVKVLEKYEEEVKSLATRSKECERMESKLEVLKGQVKEAKETATKLRKDLNKIQKDNKQLVKYAKLWGRVVETHGKFNVLQKRFYNKLCNGNADDHDGDVDLDQTEEIETDEQSKLLEHMLSDGVDSDASFATPDILSSDTEMSRKKLLSPTIKRPIPISQTPSSRQHEHFSPKVLSRGSVTPSKPKSPDKTTARTPVTRRRSRTDSQTSVISISEYSSDTDVTTESEKENGKRIGPRTRSRSINPSMESPVTATTPKSRKVAAEKCSPPKSVCVIELNEDSVVGIKPISDFSESELTVDSPRKNVSIFETNQQISMTKDARSTPGPGTSANSSMFGFISSSSSDSEPETVCPLKQSEITQDKKPVMDKENSLIETGPTTFSGLFNKTSQPEDTFITIDSQQFIDEVLSLRTESPTIMVEEKSVEEGNAGPVIVDVKSIEEASNETIVSPSEKPQVEMNLLQVDQSFATLSVGEMHAGGNQDDNHIREPISLEEDIVTDVISVSPTEKQIVELHVTQPADPISTVKSVEETQTVEMAKEEKPIEKIVDSSEKPIEKIVDSSEKPIEKIVDSSEKPIEKVVDPSENIEALPTNAQSVENDPVTSDSVVVKSSDEEFIKQSTNIQSTKKPEIQSDSIKENPSHEAQIELSTNTSSNIESVEVQHTADNRQEEKESLDIVAFPENQVEDGLTSPEKQAEDGLTSPEKQVENGLTSPEKPVKEKVVDSEPSKSIDQSDTTTSQLNAMPEMQAIQISEDIPTTEEAVMAKPSKVDELNTVQAAPTVEPELILVRSVAEELPQLEPLVTAVIKDNAVGTSILDVPTLEAVETASLSDKPNLSTSPKEVESTEKQTEDEIKEKCTSTDVPDSQKSTSVDDSKPAQLSLFDDDVDSSPDLTTSTNTSVNDTIPEKVFICDNDISVSEPIKSVNESVSSSSVSVNTSTFNDEVSVLEPIKSTNELNSTSSIPTTSNVESHSDKSDDIPAREKVKLNSPTRARPPLESSFVKPSVENLGQVHQLERKETTQTFIAPPTDILEPVAIDPSVKNEEPRNLPKTPIAPIETQSAFKVPRVPDPPKEVSQLYPWSRGVKRSAVDDEVATILKQIRTNIINIPSTVSPLPKSPEPKPMTPLVQVKTEEPKSKFPLLPRCAFNWTAKKLPISDQLTERFGAYLHPGVQVRVRFRRVSKHLRDVRSPDILSNSLQGVQNFAEAERRPKSIVKPVQIADEYFDSIDSKKKVLTQEPSAHVTISNGEPEKRPRFTLPSSPPSSSNNQELIEAQEEDDLSKAKTSSKRLRNKSAEKLAEPVPKSSKIRPVQQNKTPLSNKVKTQGLFGPDSGSESESESEVIESDSLNTVNQQPPRPMLVKGLSKESQEMGIESKSPTTGPIGPSLRAKLLAQPLPITQLGKGNRPGTSSVETRRELESPTLGRLGLAVAGRGKKPSQHFIAPPSVALLSAGMTRPKSITRVATPKRPEEAQTLTTTLAAPVAPFIPAVPAVSDDILHVEENPSKKRVSHALKRALDRDSASIASPIKRAKALEMPSCSQVPVSASSTVLEKVKPVKAPAIARILPTQQVSSIVKPPTKIDDRKAISQPAKGRRGKQFTSAAEVPTSDSGTESESEKEADVTAEEMDDTVSSEEEETPHPKPSVNEPYSQSRKSSNKDSQKSLESVESPSSPEMEICTEPPVAEENPQSPDMDQSPQSPDVDSSPQSPDIEESPQSPDVEENPQSPDGDGPQSPDDQTLPSSLKRDSLAVIAKDIPTSPIKSHDEIEPSLSPFDVVSKLLLVKNPPVTTASKKFRKEMNGFINKLFNISVEITSELLEKMTDRFVKVESRKNPSVFIRRLIAGIIKAWDDPTDTSMTPPAPPMAVVHQRCVIILKHLDEKNHRLELEPTVDNQHVFSDYFLTDVSCTMFNTQSTLTLEQICSLARAYTAVCRSRGLLGRARTFLYDCLYFLPPRSYALTYAIIFVWAEVLRALTFPLGPSCVDQTIIYLLTQCVKVKAVQGIVGKVLQIRASLKTTYGYKNATSTTIDDLVQYLMTRLSETNSIDEASSLCWSLALLCRWEGPDFAVTVIEKHLWHFLQRWSAGEGSTIGAASAIVAIGIIGKLIPTEKRNGVKRILDAMKTILANSDEVSLVIQEAAIEAVILLGESEDPKTVIGVLKAWKPKTASVTPHIQEIMKAFLKRHSDLVI